jgi:hypothetical protein
MVDQLHMGSQREQLKQQHGPGTIGDTGRGSPSGSGGAAGSVEGSSMATAATALVSEADNASTSQTAAATSEEEDEVYEAEYAAMMADMQDLISKQAFSIAGTKGGPSTDGRKGCIGQNRIGSNSEQEQGGTTNFHQQQHAESSSSGVDVAGAMEPGSSYDGLGDDDDDASSCGLGETQALVSLCAVWQQNKR